MNEDSASARKSARISARISARSRDFLPTAGWEVLKLRSELLKRIRTFFDQRDFLEVETPILSVDTVVDRHLEPIAVQHVLPSGQTAGTSRMWMQTSPEFAMKRLMAAGGRAIYQLARVFRQGESGKMHNPEFTMLEWYRADDDLAAGMQLLGEFATEFLRAGDTTFSAYRDVFRQYTDVDPLDSQTVELADAATRLSVTKPWGDDHTERDDWLNLLFAECVQPNLGMDNPQIVFDWPASQSALSIVREESAGSDVTGNEAIPVAERFELFHRGVELANGYHELTDADELLRRNQSVNRQRACDGQPSLPEQSRLLTAMQHGLPPCAGVALGVDRLLMVLLGTDDIADVIAFPIGRA